MAWFYLILAGVFEAFFPIALKASEGFTNLKYSIIGLLVVAAGMGCFTMAVKTLPAALSYVIFVGMGAVGVSITGHYFYGEQFPPLKMLFIFIILCGVAGLHYVSTK